MLAYLSRACGALGANRFTRHILPAPPLQLVGRTYLRHSLLRGRQLGPNDVTVVIGVRDRADYRLENALRSVRRQTLPAELVRIVLVDYGSGPTDAHRAEAMCHEHDAAYVRVERADVWSRSRCLNVGIRRAETKFVMSSDVDVVLSPRYLEDAVGILTTSPPSVVCSAMLDLPEESAATFERCASGDDDPPLDAWRERCHIRKGLRAHPSICVSYRAVYHAIRGYDEFYEGWGDEDDDLLRRLRYLGVALKTVDSGSFYMHQWHEAEKRGRDEVTRERNRVHLSNSHSILRNDSDWGIAFPRAG